MQCPYLIEYSGTLLLLCRAGDENVLDLIPLIKTCRCGDHTKCDLYLEMVGKTGNLNMGNSNLKKGRGLSLLQVFNTP